MLAETTDTGTLIREYIYAANQRIALVDYQQNAQGVVYFIVNDHLGTPQILLDAQQQVVWSVDQSPFGEVKVEGSVEQPLRFPGQYADVETGYSYNYFRDYDPTLGRYIESDPIGLEAGVNTFGYVSSSPLVRIDPYGLVDYVDFSISAAGTVFGVGEVALGTGGVILSMGATSTGVGSVIGVPGGIASAGAIAHGTYNVFDGMQGMANALNSTNYDGPFAQFGERFFGTSGHGVGKTMDSVLSVRGWLKSGVNVFGGAVKGEASLGDIQSVSDAAKKYFDSSNVDYCPSSGSYFH